MRRRPMRSSAGHLALCAALLWGVPAAILAQEIDADRYERSPRIPRELLQAPVASSALGGQEQVPGNFVRWIQGLDPTPVPFTPEEAVREIQDPFGKALLAQAGQLPGDVETVLQMLGDPDAPETELSDQTVYIVSASGQITLEQAPDIKRQPRAVILRRDHRALEAVFVAPSMNRTGTLEVMGWDSSKGLFNFYERVLLDAAGTEVAWIWRGDSSHAWREETRNQSCFNCHRSGEVNMKELRLPWQNWHSQSATIKPDSIPEDSPLRLNPIFAIEPASRFLRGAEEFERAINQWISRSNRTRVARFEAGELPPLHVLHPFFETSTAQLIASVEQSSPTGEEPITFPASMFVDQRGLFDVGELFCDSLLGFAGQLSMPRADYRQGLVALGFRMTAGAAFEERPGDTHFALLTSEVPRVDFDAVQQMVRAGLLSKKTTANLMLIDLENPVYSPIRAWIFEQLWAVPFGDASAGLDQAIVSALSDLDAPGTPEAVRVELAEFIARDALSGADFEAAACARVDRYLGSVVGQFEAGEALQYMRLVGSRHLALRTSDHSSLIESPLLLPVSDVPPGLVMQRDGTVGPSTLVGQ